MRHFLMDYPLMAKASCCKKLRATPVSHGFSVGQNSPTIRMALGEQCLQKAVQNGADNKRKHAEKWVLMQ